MCCFNDEKAEAQRDETVAHDATTGRPSGAVTTSSMPFHRPLTFPCMISFEPKDEAPGLSPSLFLIHTS